METDRPRRISGWVLRIAHWAIFILIAFVLALLATPPLAFAIAGLQAALGPAAPATKDIVFYGWVPALAIATVWSSRRINRRLDKRFGRAPDAAAPIPQAADPLAR